MDYEKKYKEAIERLKQWDKEHPNGYVISDRDEFIFPELKEIEGEKVRKWLINLLSTMQFHHCDDDAGMPNKALSWIEKQGEQKPAEWSEEDKNIIVKIKTKIAQCNGFNKKNREEVFGLIDSLSHKSTWKPSEEQMRALEAVIGCVGNNLSEEYSVKWLWELLKLKEQLKKQREE